MDVLKSKLETLKSKLLSEKLVNGVISNKFLNIKMNNMENNVIKNNKIDEKDEKTIANEEISNILSNSNKNTNSGENELLKCKRSKEDENSKELNIKMIDEKCENICKNDNVLKNNENTCCNSENSDYLQFLLYQKINQAKKDLIESNKDKNLGLNLREVFKFNYGDNINKTIYSTKVKKKEIIKFLESIMVKWGDSLKDYKENDYNDKIKIYEDCKENIVNLIDVLSKNIDTDKLNNFFVDKLFDIIVFISNEEFISADKSYYDLAIGKSQWPRAYNEKKSIHDKFYDRYRKDNEVAYILNDDTTRKYLTSVKRIISFCCNYKSKKN